MLRQSIFKEKRGLLVPEVPTNKPLTDEKGNPLSGDEIIMSMANFSESYIHDNEEAVPHVEPVFVEWLNQYKKMRSEGKTSDQILKLTVSRVGI